MRTVQSNFKNLLIVRVTIGNERYTLKYVRQLFHCGNDNDRN